jgi:hypothetical protein
MFHHLAKPWTLTHAIIRPCRMFHRHIGRIPHHISVAEAQKEMNGKRCGS